MQIVSRSLLRYIFPKYTFSQITYNQALKNNEQQPIHLRPYDAAKYEVPSSKLKLTTGYAFLDVEPVPRAKIMKICYIVLDKLREIPEEALYRLYTEEKIKYIMKLTDSIDDVQRLEQEIGFESIELFIQHLHKEIKLVDDMKLHKPWDMNGDPTSYEILRQKRQDLKHQVQNRQPREQAKFIQ